MNYSQIENGFPRENACYGNPGMEETDESEESDIPHKNGFYENPAIEETEESEESDIPHKNGFYENPAIEETEESEESDFPHENACYPTMEETEESEETDVEMNPSAQSINEVNLKTIQFLRNVLQCPYCKQYAAPRLYLCPKGNLSCVECKICYCDEGSPHHKRLDSNMERCFILEKIYDLVPFPCKYRSVGCTKIMYGSKIKAHEAKCAYEDVFQCPFADKICRKVNYLKGALEAHLMREHGDRLLPIGLLVELPLNVYRKYTNFFICFSSLFICVIENTQEGLKFSIRRYTREKVTEDKKYLYEFQLVLDNVGHYLALKKDCLTVGTVLWPFWKHDHEFDRKYLSFYCTDVIKFIIRCGVRCIDTDL